MKDLRTVMYVEDGILNVGLKSSENFEGSNMDDFGDFIAYHEFSPFDFGTHSLEGNLILTIREGGASLEEVLGMVNEQLQDLDISIQSPLCRSVASSIKYVVMCQLQIMHDIEELPNSCDAIEALTFDDLGERAEDLLIELAEIIVGTVKK